MIVRRSLAWLKWVEKTLQTLMAYLEKVTNVYYERITAWLDSNPLSIFTPHFQSPDLVLDQDGERTAVVVSAYTECEVRIRTCWVLVQADEIGVFVPVVVEICHWQAQALRNQPQKLKC